MLRELVVNKFNQTLQFEKILDCYGFVHLLHQFSTHNLAMYCLPSYPKFERYYRHLLSDNLKRV